jgi:hypothetical protein
LKGVFLIRKENIGAIVFSAYLAVVFIVARMKKKEKKY